MIFKNLMHEWLTRRPAMAEQVWIIKQNTSMDNWCFLFLFCGSRTYIWTRTETINFPKTDSFKLIHYLPFLEKKRTIDLYAVGPETQKIWCNV